MRRIAFAITAAGLVACQFGTIQTLLYEDDMLNVRSVAQSQDSESLFIAEYGAFGLWTHDPAASALHVVHPNTGAIQASHDLWDMSTWEVVDLAMSQDHTDRVWALHRGGYIVEWDSDLEDHDLIWPPPEEPGDTRMFCSVDQSTNGDLYLTTVDLYGPSLLWRFSFDSGWSSVEMERSSCAEIAVDDVGRTTVYVMEFDGHMLSFTSDLIPIGVVSTPISVGPNDFDVLGGTMVFDVVDSPYDSTDDVVGLVIFDVGTGVVHDEVPLGPESVDALHLAHDVTTSTFTVFMGGGGIFQPTAAPPFEPVLRRVDLE